MCFHKEQSIFTSTLSTNKKALLAIYRAGLRIIKTSTHTIIERLVGEKEADKLKTISLSNNTI
jgi:hypothetical protein